MSAVVISLFITIGACTWIYVKLQNRSGNNTQQSLIATVVIAIFLFAGLLSISSLL